MPEDTQQPTPSQAAMVDFMVIMLMSERDCLCRRIAAIEKLLEQMGRPVSRPKILNT
jgi:hypothetical protein